MGRGLQHHLTEQHCRGRRGPPVTPAPPSPLHRGQLNPSSALPLPPTHSPKPLLPLPLPALARKSTTVLGVPGQGACLARGGMGNRAWGLSPLRGPGQNKF